MNYIDKAITDALMVRVGEHLKKPRRAVIGNPVTQDVFATDTNYSDNMLVWIHFAGSDTSGYVTALRGNMRGGELFYGRPVMVKRNDSGMYYIVGVDATDDAIFSEGIDEVHDQQPVQLNQIMYGTMHPVTSTLSVTVANAMYGIDWVSDQTTDDFSSGTVQDTSGSNIVVPTNNNRAIAVLVQVQSSTGTLTYKQSSEFNASLSLQLAYKNSLLPEPDSGRYRVGYLRLAAGISEFTYNDVWSVPWFISSEPEQGFPLEIESSWIVPDGYQQVKHNGIIVSDGSMTVKGQLVVL